MSSSGQANLLFSESVLNQILISLSKRFITVLYIKFYNRKLRYTLTRQMSHLTK